MFWSAAPTKSRSQEPRSGSRPDSRTFSRYSGGIHLGSSQNVNVVLFSLACRKVSIRSKYFVVSHLHPGDGGVGSLDAQACGNPVESSSVQPAYRSTTA